MPKFIPACQSAVRTSATALGLDVAANVAGARADEVIE
jgi:hypothetical protein